MQIAHWALQMVALPANKMFCILTLLYKCIMVSLLKHGWHAENRQLNGTYSFFRCAYPIFTLRPLRDVPSCPMALQCMHQKLILR